MIEDELEPLITCCPNCSTRFRVTESQLAVAAGRVRCGACLTVFEGTAHLLLDDDDRFTSDQEADAALDELLNELGGFSPEENRLQGAPDQFGVAAAGDDLAPAAFYGGHEESAEEFSFTPIYVEEVVEEVADASSDDTALEETAGGDDLRGGPDLPDVDPTGPVGGAYPDGSGAVAAPEQHPIAEDVSDLDTDESATAGLVEANAATAPAAEDELLKVTAPVDFSPEPRRWWVGAVAAVFVLALIGQILYFQFPTWSRDAELRPVYDVICGAVGCDLPQMRDLSALSTRNLVVRSHPELDRALVVDAVIVNEADFEQPFPDLELRFTAVDGVLVAGRRFAPEEYLTGEDARPDVMPPRTPVQVSLEIEDPGPAAVNYMLRFR